MIGLMLAGSSLIGSSCSATWRVRLRARGRTSHTCRAQRPKRPASCMSHTGLSSSAIIIRFGKGLRMATHKRTIKANPLDLYAVPRCQVVTGEHRPGLGVRAPRDRLRRGDQRAPRGSRRFGFDVERATYLTYCIADGLELGSPCQPMALFNGVFLRASQGPRPPLLLRCANEQTVS
jgi:hypothetical protein